MFGRENAHVCKSTKNRHIFISLQSIVSLLVLAHSSTVSLADCTHKVPLLELGNPTRYFNSLFSVQFMKSLLYWFRNFGTHPKMGSKLTLDFLLLYKPHALPNNTNILRKETGILLLFTKELYWCSLNPPFNSLKLSFQPVKTWPFRVSITLLL